MRVTCPLEFDGIGSYDFEYKPQVASIKPAEPGSRLRFFVEGPAQLGSGRSVAVNCAAT